VGDRPPSPFASLRPLLKPHERDAADGLRKLAAALGGLDARVRLHLQLVDGEADWLVSFMDYDLGFFDHETGRLGSAENPFAAKVLPCRRSSRSTNCRTS